MSYQRIYNRVMLLFLEKPALKRVESLLIKCYINITHPFGEQDAHNSWKELYEPQHTLVYAGKQHQYTLFCKRLSTFQRINSGSCVPLTGLNLSRKKGVWIITTKRYPMRLSIQLILHSRKANRWEAFWNSSSGCWSLGWQPVSSLQASMALWSTAQRTPYSH